MNAFELKTIIVFYENELTNNILTFWLKHCPDNVNGGYFNCFNNCGTHLISRDKHIWSQGRFVWLWLRLAITDHGLFRKEQREEYLSLARSGRDFLIKHCLLEDEKPRCIFLTDETGAPRQMNGYSRRDISIYADCFVIMAFVRYVLATNERVSFDFCKTLYKTVVARVDEKRFETFPYPLSSEYREHGIPMMLLNVTKEVYEVALVFDKAWLGELHDNLDCFASDVLNHLLIKI